MFWKFTRFLSWPFVLLPAGVFRLIWRLLDIFDGRFGAFLRYMLICHRIAKCGDRVYWGIGIYIDYPKELNIGRNVSIHNHVTFLAKGGIYIGDNVAIAHASSFVTGNHTWTNAAAPIKYNDVTLGSISVADDVWIGCGVRILAGVTIGPRSVIAAGAVVTQSTVGNAVFGGVPAKKIKNI